MNFYKRLKLKIKPHRRRLKLKVKYFLARLHRRRLNSTTFVAVSGSSAKTTSAKLAAEILSRFGFCRQTQDFNALDSVVRLLLNTDRRTRYCVAELGASGPGTLDLSIRLFQPDIAVLTVINREHYGAYRDIEEIAAEKEKVVAGLSPGGIAVLNIDDPLVRAIGERCSRRVLWFGEDEKAALRLLEVRSCWPEPLTLRVAFEGRTYEVATKLHGVHMAVPVLAALGVAVAADVPLEKAIPVLARVSPPDGRMQEVACGDDVTFIRDDWKAPLWSMDAPLAFLRNARAARKIAVIGTISDSTGDYGPKYRKLAKAYREVADKVVFVGPHALRGLRKGRNDDPRVKGFLHIRNAAEFLRGELKRGDLVLLKGSNKQDHLLRLLLSHNDAIRCWEIQCEAGYFCTRCSKLFDLSFNAVGGTPDSLPSGGTAPVVVGLGNPGERFSDTPHNVGHRVLDAVAKVLGGAWREDPDGWVCTVGLNGDAVHLFKPGSWMNYSGPVVRRFLGRVGTGLQNCIIVHDDLNLAFGDVRMKPDGGDAGHKGMRSVLAEFETERVYRMRIGTAPEKGRRDMKQYVLAKFSKEQKTTLAPVIETAGDLLMTHLRNRIGSGGQG